MDPLHPLQSSVLETLAEKGPLTVRELHRIVQGENGLVVSVPSLYRLLQKLINQQVLVRTKGKVALHLVWISRVSDFVRRAHETVSSDREDSLMFETLSPGQKRTFHADSLNELDPVWSHAILELARIATDREWYVYNSHPWYSLGMRDTETRLYQSIVSSGIHCHMLYGNTSFLDSYGEKMIRVDGYRTALASDTGFPSEGLALWSAGEFVIECLFPTSISRHFAFFFQTIQRIEDFDPELFADVFKMKARCKITVRRNATDAARIRRSLEPYFR